MDNIIRILGKFFTGSRVQNDIDNILLFELDELHHDFYQKNRLKSFGFAQQEANIEVVKKQLSKINCNSCKFFNIKSDEHGICENPKNDFSLRFNSSKKGFEMLKDDVKLIDFINEIEPYTTFYIHQDFGCINFSA